MKTVSSLFSGCGGLDFGMEGEFRFCGREFPRTSFETVFACDINSAAKKMYDAYADAAGRRNRLTQESIVDLIRNSPEKLPKCDVLTGGFPCQAFSAAGLRMGFKSRKNHLGENIANGPQDESSGMLYSWMCRSIEFIQPKVVIAENVKGLLTMPGAIKKIRSDFSDMGYLVTYKLLNASDYGVPQARERVIILGIRTESMTEEAKNEWDMFLPSFDLFPSKTTYAVTCKDALAGLLEPDLSQDPSQKSFSSAKWLPKGQGQKEIRMNGFAPTIRAEHHGNIEFRRLSREHKGLGPFNANEKERRLTVRECARLQSFPDEYRFVPTVSGSEAYKLIGNAVPPVLGWHIARKFEENWTFLFGDSNG